MNTDLIKMRKDLAKMNAVLQEYTAIYKASDGIDSKEQKDLDKIQAKITLIENKLHELLGDNISTSNPALVAFENKWMDFIQTLEGDIVKYGLNVPQ